VEKKQQNRKEKRDDQVDDQDQEGRHRASALMRNRSMKPRKKEKTK
jgi:hypothetical protein